MGLYTVIATHITRRGIGALNEYVKVTTGVPLERVLFEIQKAQAKGMILRICPSEGYDFENLPQRRVCFCWSDPMTRIFTENHQNCSIV